MARDEEVEFVREREHQMKIRHRQEFASLIERSGGGVGGLIAQLKAKINVARQ